MKLFLASLFFLTTSACAQHIRPVTLAPPGTTGATALIQDTAKDAEIELLRAQLAEAQVMASLIEQAGRHPDVVGSRFAVIQARQRLEAAQKAKTNATAPVNPAP